MEPKALSAKSHGILEAISAGHSCEQILAADRTLTYYDIFHAVTDIPTSQWKKESAGIPGYCGRRRAGSARIPAKKRTD